MLAAGQQVAPARSSSRRCPGRPAPKETDHGGRLAPAPRKRAVRARAHRGAERGHGAHQRRAAAVAERLSRRLSRRDRRRAACGAAPAPRRARGSRSRSSTGPNRAMPRVSAPISRRPRPSRVSPQSSSTWPRRARRISRTQANLLVVASTWGEGDPPERAAEFYAALMAEDAPRFEGVRFAVLALGDSSYVNFCEVGRRIDARLEALGGERIAPRVDCDLDYEAPAAAWSGSALEELAKRAEPDAAAVHGGDIIHVDFAAPAAHIALFQGQSVPGRDHREHQSERQPLDQADDPSGSVARRLRARLRARQLARHRARRTIRRWSRRCCARRISRAIARSQAQLTSEFDITALSRQVIEGYAALNPDPRLARAARGRRLARLPGRPADRRSARGFPGRADAGAAHRPAAQAAAAALLGRLGARGQPGRGASPGRRRALPEPRPRATAASPRASSPSGCGSATGSRSTSSRTRTSACRTIRTGRS